MTPLDYMRSPGTNGEESGENEREREVNGIKRVGKARFCCMEWKNYGAPNRYAGFCNAEYIFTFRWTGVRYESLAVMPLRFANPHRWKDGLKGMSSRPRWALGTMMLGVSRQRGYVSRVML